MKQADTIPSPSHYSVLAKAFHWGFIALFAYGIAKQVNNLEDLHDAALLRFEVLFAVLFLLFLGLRYVYMSRTQKSALPDTAPLYQKCAAKAVHYGLYLSLSAIALSGLLIAALFSLGFERGFLIEGAINLHELSNTTSYWLIFIHILAALYHRFRRDGIWQAMVPFFKDYPS